MKHSNLIFPAPPPLPPHEKQKVPNNNQRSDDVILAIQVEKSDDQEANLPHTFDFNDSDGAIEERFELGCRSYYFSRTNRIAKR